MAIVPWKQKETWLDPFREMELLQNEINRLFDFSLTRSPDRVATLAEGVWAPAIDVYESKDNMMVKAELPGLTKEDINVTIHDGSLIIRGEKKAESESKEKHSVRKERFYGSFSRAIALGSDVDASKASATFANGILELTLPKKEEAKAKEVKIEVK